MIDRREPPALGPVEPDRGAPTPRRRLSPRAARIAAAVAALIGLGFGLSWVTRRAADYVHEQPSRRLAFRDIELDPAPPRWIRSGAAGLLERVRTRSGLPETLAPLAVDLDQLTQDFRRSPWVERVESIRRAAPNRLIVRLRYREPVAVVTLREVVVVLDRDGVVLPDDADPGDAMEILGLNPLEAREGLPLKVGPANHPDIGALPAAAARLAEFVRRRQATRPDPPFPVQAVVAKCDPRHCWLWLVGLHSVRVLWGQVPEPNAPDALSPEARWDILQAWGHSPGAEQITDPENQWLKFEGKTLRRRSR